MCQKNKTAGRDKIKMVKATVILKLKQPSHTPNSNRPAPELSCIHICK